MYLYFGILARVSLHLMVLTLALPLLSGCGKKNALQVTPGEGYSYPREYPRR